MTAPFIKSLNFVHIVSSKDGTFGLNLGTFGSCFPGSTSLLGIQLSDTACTKPTYPYSVNPVYFGKNDTITKALNNISKGLILNPFAAAFCLLAIIPSVFAVCSDHRFLNVAAFFLYCLATLCSWAAFVVNVIFAAVSKNKVKSNSNGEFTGKYGNAVWISLIGAVLISVATSLALFGACCCIKPKHHNEAAHPVDAHHHNGDIEGDHHHAVGAEKDLEEATPVVEKHSRLPWKR